MARRVDVLRWGEGMTQEAGRRGGPDQRAVLLAAGLADLAVSTLGSALGGVRQLLRRSDAAELAAEAEQELTARGRLLLDRHAAVPPAHLEVLARHALARRASDGA
ncbi:hypothetical protein GCM10009654_53530 [Streptomyces hebeiensis]|uniref:Polyprenyl synthetase n=2 Tax=Streptomyces hebeiensis TaxID=229486 RepID=A0ABN1V1B1_9ACTN